MKNFVLIISVFLSGCIGTDILDDLMEEQILIESTITSLKIGESYQFHARYFNNIGEEVTAEPEWDSSNPAIISINNNGLATAIAPGQVVITASYQGTSDELMLEATTGETTTNPLQRKTELQSVSSYPLSGSVTLTANDQGLLLEFGDNFSSTSGLVCLFIK
ncbi:MAG TPA: Ig-like domain-containing protein [Fulvivirga sp.]|nr:Ig-like domain-containing protein [Fulvivirga sp.]